MDSRPAPWFDAGVEEMKREELGMPEFEAADFAYAGLMLAAKTLEKLQAKQLITEKEAVSTVQEAVNAMLNSGNPSAVSAAKVLLHFYSLPSNVTT